MPDFTYHPFFKPLLFAVSPDTGRRLTVGALALQGRTAAGRALFRALSRAAPPASLATEAMGLRFPSPIGLGPGIDVAGDAAVVMQHLGFGFLVVGPAGALRVPPASDTEPLRIAERQAIAWSEDEGAPGIEALLGGLRAGAPLGVPIGVALRGQDLVAAARAAAGADFVIVPARDRDTLRAVRAATQRPVVVRLSPVWTDAELDDAVDAAIDARLDGCIATGAAPCPLLRGGIVEGPFLLERALATAEWVARRAGDRLVVIGAGGVQSPDDAARFLDAGARLVEVAAGLVYAGPGLPKRVARVLVTRTAPVAPAPSTGRRPTALEPTAPRAVSAAPPPAPFFSGWLGAFVTGAVLVASGLFALVLAATVQLLPNDVRYLGMTVRELCAHDACRIVHFMAHDRVSFGGSIDSIGAIYVWLAAVPLRRGEAWAWWTLVLSGIVGFASFLTYLGYGYLDTWHGGATLLLLPVFVLGLADAYRRLERPRGIGDALRIGARAWIWSPAGMGRACVAFSAFGMIAGGLTIMAVGMTRVFVPTDLAFMQLGVSEIEAINPRLVSLIAHDRAGFGGGLCSGGIAVILSLWCGARPAARGLWLALSVAGTVGFATAIGVHPMVGYTSFEHLLPAYLGALAFALGIVWLRRPMLDADVPADRFPDV